MQTKHRKRQKADESGHGHTQQAYQKLSSAFVSQLTAIPWSRNFMTCPLRATRHMCYIKAKESHKVERRHPFWCCERDLMIMASPAKVPINRQRGSIVAASI